MNSTNQLRSHIKSIPYVWDQMYYMYIIGVIGNALVIIYYLKNNGKPLRNLSSYHLLIVQLAIVDFLICLLLTVNGFDLRHLHPMPLFLALAFFDTLSLLSCSFLVFISYQRYRQIIHPLRRKIKKRTVLLLTLMLTSFLFGVNSLIFYYDSRIVLTYVVSLFMHLIMETSMSIMVMFYFYRQISLKIYSETLRIDGTSFHKIQIKKKRTALNTLKGLLLVYVVCIVPGRSTFLVIQFLDTYTMLTRRYFTFFNHLFNAGFYLFNINNMVNIFVYARLVVDFRRFLINIFTFQWIRHHKERTSSTSTFFINSHFSSNI